MDPQYVHDTRTSEDLVIVPALYQGGESHDLGNSTEAQDSLLDQSQVGRDVAGMLQSIADHVVEALYRLLCMLRLGEVLQVVGVLLPDLLWPQ